MVQAFLLYLQLKNVFRLEENVSRAVGQKALTHWGNYNLNFRLTHDQVVLPETAADFSSFELGVTCITKHLMTGPRETVSFVSPQPQCSP